MRSSAWKAKYQALVAALFDVEGCDCDSWYEVENHDSKPWAAPHHASDCPVYERWRGVEDGLRNA